jgi:hypothetical protein
MEAADQNGDHSNQSRQAACLGCRRSKIKCIRDPAATTCKRCKAGGHKCVIPEYHVGRYKGVKNKRSGLEKAIYQVEQAIKRSKTSGADFDPDTDVDLRKLISHSQPLADQAPVPSNFIVRQPKEANGFESARQDSIEGAEEIALENADNPLQLLAMASAMPNQSPSSAITASPAVNASHASSHAVDSEDADLQVFFGSFTPVLDNSRDIDPVDLGLATEEEADSLFA